MRVLHPNFELIREACGLSADELLIIIRIIICACCSHQISFPIQTSLAFFIDSARSKGQILMAIGVGMGYFMNIQWLIIFSVFWMQELFLIFYSGLFLSQIFMYFLYLF